MKSFARFLRGVADRIDPAGPVAISAPSSAALRLAMLRKADAYAHTTGLSMSAIGRLAVNDDRFLLRARKGANFTIETYQRMIDWLDAKAVAA